MLQLCGRRSIKGRKSPVRECLQAFPALFPLYSLLLFFFSSWIFLPRSTIWTPGTGYKQWNCFPQKSPSRQHCKNLWCQRVTVHSYRQFNLFPINLNVSLGSILGNIEILLIIVSLRTSHIVILKGHSINFLNTSSEKGTYFLFFSNFFSFQKMCEM